MDKDYELWKITRHARLMSDKAHEFNHKVKILEKICEDLVNMPKGVESHSYSDYKLIKKESMTCENCKYDNFENSRCDLKRVIPSYYIDGFYCNRWEIKNDN